jgi:hypothetical protein
VCLVSQVLAVCNCKVDIGNVEHNKDDVMVFK